jgi:hypothetical protein
MMYFSTSRDLTEQSMNIQQPQKTSKTHHAPRQSTSHESKPDEQEKARPPHSRRISIIILSNPILVDRVDDEHVKERVNSREWVMSMSKQVQLGERAGPSQ